MEIHRHNATSQILGAPGWFLTYAARHLSVPVELGAKKGDRFGAIWKHQGDVWATLVRGNEVAAGLTSHVCALARHYGLDVRVKDCRTPPEERLPLWSVKADWRPYQTRVHEKAIQRTTGVIDAPPRSGKTLMAARLIDTFGCPTVCIAPSVAIVRQTWNVMRRSFGDDWVARLDGESKGSERDVSKPLVIATAASAARQPQEWWDTRDLLVIDEFHHAAAETYHKINMLAKNVYYRFGFTGTHFRSGEDRLAMEAICSHVIDKIELDDLTPNYLATPRVVYTPVRGICRPEGNSWDALYRAGIVDHEARNDLIVKIANTVSATVPTIVLTRRRRHADELGDRISNSVVAKGGASVLTSRSITEFLAGEHRVLVGTTVIGEGVDVPAAGALVFASGGDAGVAMMQSYFRPMTGAPGKSVGRIFDFRDLHHRTLRRHSDARISMARSQFGNENVVVGE